MAFLSFLIAETLLWAILVVLLLFAAGYVSGILP